MRRSAPCTAFVVRKVQYRYVCWTGSPIFQGRVQGWIASTERRWLLATSWAMDPAQQFSQHSRSNSAKERSHICLEGLHCSLEAGVYGWRPLPAYSPWLQTAGYTNWGRAHPPQSRCWTLFSGWVKSRSGLTCRSSLGSVVRERSLEVVDKENRGWWAHTNKSRDVHNPLKVAKKGDAVTCTVSHMMKLSRVARKGSPWRPIPPLGPGLLIEAAAYLGANSWFIHGGLPFGPALQLLMARSILGLGKDSLKLQVTSFAQPLNPHHWGEHRFPPKERNRTTSHVICYAQRPYVW